jgi:hypothetical protein
LRRQSPRPANQPVPKTSDVASKLGISSLEGTLRVATKYRQLEERATGRPARRS